MPRTYDDEWVKKWLDKWPPECYKMTVFEAAGFLGYGKGVLHALAACCNYGFRRGRNFERNNAKRKRFEGG